MEQLLTHRTVRALNLDRGDVSIVNWGANPTTHAALVEARRLAGISIPRNTELSRRRYETASTVTAAFQYLQATADIRKVGA